jgi:glycosyltransferase involved in cell wall biosynthesis
MRSKSKKPKICIITTVGLSLNKLFPDFYPRLIEKGFEVVGIAAEDSYIKDVRRQGVKVITVPMTRRFTPLQDLKCLWMIYKIFKREEFDLIHYSTPKASLLAGIAGRLTNSPALLFTSRGLGYIAFSGIKRLIGKYCEKLSFRCAHYVIVIADSLKAKIISENLSTREKLFVLGAGSSKGVNLRKFRIDAKTIEEALKIRQNLGIQTSSVVIGYVGRLTQDKNLKELLEAFYNIYERSMKVHLLMVGDQDKRSPLSEEIMADIRSHPAVHLVPFRENVQDYFAAMDIFVLPSSDFREGFGNVLIEASAMRIPVISTSLGGCSDAVENGFTGILLDQPSVKCLESALAELIENPSQRKEMGRNGETWVRENFDRDLVWERTIQVYEQMISRGHYGF